jgi:hypothetical protein
VQSPVQLGVLGLHRRNSVQRYGIPEQVGRSTRRERYTSADTRYCI